MTNPQHEALVEAVAHRSELVALLRREGKHSGVWFSEHLLKAADDIAALSATAATPSVEVVRLRATAVKHAIVSFVANSTEEECRLPAIQLITNRCHLMADGVLASLATLEPQGKDV